MFDTLQFVCSVRFLFSSFIRYCCYITVLQDQIFRNTKYQISNHNPETNGFSKPVGSLTNLFLLFCH